MSLIEKDSNSIQQIITIVYPASTELA